MSLVSKKTGGYHYYFTNAEWSEVLDAVDGRIEHLEVLINEGDYESTEDSEDLVEAMNTLMQARQRLLRPAQEVR